MQIKVTDERLLEKTGGIIQGMSGSPIIQNNKVIGAVTHAIVDNVSNELIKLIGNKTIKDFFVKNYEFPVIDNGIILKNMIRLMKNL